MVGLQTLLDSLPGCPIEPPPSANNLEQKELLAQKLRHELAEGRHFSRLGKGFDLKPAQAFRDAVKHGIDLYEEASGKWSVVLENDPSRPHKAICEAFSNGVKKLFQPHNKGELLIDDAETAIDWIFASSSNREKWGEKEPDFALIPEPTEDGFWAAILGEHSFHHETVEQLMILCQSHAELTDSEVVIGFNSASSKDSADLWKFMRVDIFVIQKHPDSSELIFSGPLRIGAGSGCEEAGLEKYALGIKRGLLMRRDEDGQFADQLLELDLYHVMKNVGRHLQIGKGALSDENLRDYQWRSRHRKMIQLANELGLRRHQDLPHAEAERLYIRLQADI